MPSKSKAKPKAVSTATATDTDTEPTVRTFSIEQDSKEAPKATIFDSNDPKIFEAYMEQMIKHREVDIEKYGPFILQLSPELYSRFSVLNLKDKQLLESHRLQNQKKTVAKPSKVTKAVATDKTDAKESRRSDRNKNKSVDYKEPSPVTVTVEEAVEEKSADQTTDSTTTTTDSTTGKISNKPSAPEMRAEFIKQKQNRSALTIEQIVEQKLTESIEVLKSNSIQVINQSKLGDKLNLEQVEVLSVAIDLVVILENKSNALTMYTKCQSGKGLTILHDQWPKKGKVYYEFDGKAFDYEDYYEYVHDRYGFSRGQISYMKRWYVVCSKVPYFIHNERPWSWICKCFDQSGIFQPIVDKYAQELLQ